MALTRCDCCQGRRNVVGMGGMQRACSNCKGVGFVKEAEPVVVVKRKRRAPAEMLAAADKGE